MIDANSVAIGIVSGVSVLVAGKLILKGITNHKNGKNPQQGQFHDSFKRELNGMQARFEDHKKTVIYKDTCDATHKGVDDKLNTMDKKLDRLLDK